MTIHQKKIDYRIIKCKNNIINQLDEIFYIKITVNVSGILLHAK